MLESHHHFTITVRPDGLIALPPEALQSLDVAPGDRLVISQHNASLTMHSEKLKFDRLQSLAAIQAKMRELVPPNVNMVDELIAERRQEAKREQEQHESRYGISFDAGKQ